jgi:hypothetical protein
MATKKSPVYRAYTVERIDEDNSFWTQIGVAFAHDDMKGFNVVLKALPLDGRLVLRRYTEAEPQKAIGTADAATNCSRMTDAP